MDTTTAISSPTALVLNQSNNSVSSVSSNSSSSASSGYGSATATPTTPLSTNYDGCAHSSPTTNVATVATVAPFFSEAMSGLTDASHLHQQRQHHHQQQQQQQQQQHHHQQLQQQQQQHQQLQQQYFPNYSYASSGNGTTMPGVPIDYNNYNSYLPTGGAAAPYHQSVAPSRYEKLTMANNLGSNGTKSYTPIQQQSGSGKPQAAATPFFAQPLYASGGGGSSVGGSGAPAYYDAYKYKKMPAPAADYGVYGSYPGGYNQAATQLHQQQQQPQHQPQQQYYVGSGIAPKPQLAEPNYAAVRPSGRAHATAPIYGGNSSMPYYEKFDKYGMYAPGSVGYVSSAQPPPTHLSHAPPLGAAHFSPPDHLAADAYRKPSACHWNLDFSSGNCRAIPPPSHASAMPTPSHAYHTTSHHLGTAAQQPNPEVYYEKFGKYDKYNPAPLQTAAAPNAAHSYSTPYTPPRNLWPGGAAAIAAAEGASLVMSGVSNVPNGRQNCCTQAYTQQNCFYPRGGGYPAAPPSYPDGPQTPQFSPNVAKLSDYVPPPQSHAAKLKHSNDLYMTSPYDNAPTAAHLGYNYPTSNGPASAGNVISNNSHYPNLAPNEPTAPTSAYYNDLNSNNLDMYTSAARQQTRTGQMQGVQRAPCKPTVLDYRKPQANCYPVPQISPLSNLEAHVDNYVTGSTYQLSPELPSPYFVPNINQSQPTVNERHSAPKNLSIRDFLSSWNEDEEETAILANEETAVVVPASPQALDEPLALNQAINYELPMPPALKDLPAPESTAPKDQIGATVTGSAAGSAVAAGGDVVDVNQYMNLPDIIIDIEKSNNALPHTADDSFGSFDVEKELDELRLQKGKQTNFESSCLEEPTKVIEAMLSKPHNEAIIAEPTKANETELIASAVEEFTSTQTVKSSEEFDSNSINSNGSSFEEAYETFIKHSNSGSEVTNETTEPKSVPQVEQLAVGNAQDETEYKQHLKKFSKFYKRKRKLTETNSSNEIDATALKQSKTPLDTEKQITNNMGKTLRNPKKFRQWLRSVKNRVSRLYGIELRYYYGTLRKLRRFLAAAQARPKTSELVKRYIAERRERLLTILRRRQKKERHLPLIKRQSVKQCLYNPQTLKVLSVSYVNSDSFRQSLMMPIRTETVIKTVYEAKRATYGGDIGSVSCIDLTKSPVAMDDHQQEKTEQLTTPKTDKEVVVVANENNAETAIDQVEKIDHKQVIVKERDSQEMTDSPSLTKSSVPSVELMESFKGFDDADSESESLLNQNKVTDVELVATTDSRAVEHDTTRNTGIYGECKRRQDDCDFVDMQIKKPQILDIKKLKELEIQEWLRKNIESTNCAEEIFTEAEAEPEPIDLILKAPVRNVLSQDSLVVDTNELDCCQQQTTVPLNKTEIIDLDESSSSSESDSGSSTKENPTRQGEKCSNSSSSSSSSSTSCSSSSSSSDDDSDFNELAALEKELSQQPLNDESVHCVPRANDPQVVEDVVSNNENDIANLKKILESDGEDVPPADDCNHTAVASTKEQLLLNEAELTIPKLSDLCKNALNSSLQTNELVLKIDDGENVIHAERELSVEEALAEMYQQIGVVSDPESLADGNADEAALEAGKTVDGASQDVLLIDLAEIFNSHNDLYVLQCDMNENEILRVVTADEAGDINNIVSATTVESRAGTETERVNTMQLIEILNATEVEEGQVNNDLFVLNNIESDGSVNVNVNVDSSSNAEMSAAHANPNDECSVSSHYELPQAIHHEEIVPDNYKDFEQQKFLKYLHEKYVQQRISKYYHANCVLRKYKRRLIRKIQKPNKCCQS